MPYQYLYCNSSRPHQLDGLYPTGTTCSGKSGQVYTSSYDAWGNVTSRFYSGTTATLSYDKLDHFVMWDAGSTNREWYVYDSGGSRVLRRSTNSSSTTLTVYAFGLEEHVYSSSGSNQGNTYYYPLGGQLIGELTGSATQFMLTDALGSVLATVSNVAGSAAVQGNQVYGPYGKQRYKFGTLGTSKGFTGQYNDSLTGLDYYNARYYDPKVGVFLSADTVEGNGVGRDPYGYVGGNPETKNDPTGHRFIDPETGQLGPLGPITTNSQSRSGPPQPTDPCTLDDCTVTLSYGNVHNTYTLKDLTDPKKRRQFLVDFYNEFAPGYETAELDFFDYLLNSGRLGKRGGYWDNVDYQLARDQLLAAYDRLDSNHHAAQNTMVTKWLTFLGHPSNNAWWAAHNSSINAADKRERQPGGYIVMSILRSRSLSTKLLML